MDRVQALASAARSPVAKFHELRLKYWNRDIEVISCFEGGDDISFYLPKIRSYLRIESDRLAFVNCGGKGIVVNLWGMCVAQKWNLNKIGFFVDRDLDDLLDGNPQSDQIYVTDFYSIESHSADRYFFDAVWQQTFRLALDDPRYQAWSTSFRQGLSKLSAELRVFFWLAVAYKRSGGGVDFDKITMSDYYRIGSGGAFLRASPAKSVDLSKAYLGNVRVSDVRSAKRDLAFTPDLNWLRGKAVLEFAVAFFGQMKRELTARGTENRCKVRVHFNDDFAISLLCSHVDAPPTLIEFLGSWRGRIERFGVVPM